MLGESEAELGEKSAMRQDVCLVSTEDSLEAVGEVRICARAGQIGVVGGLLSGWPGWLTGCSRVSTDALFDVTRERGTGEEEIRRRRRRW